MFSDQLLFSKGDQMRAIAQYLILLSMRIELTELPADKFNLQELVPSNLLLRLLRAKDTRDFVQLINRLTHDQRMQIHQEIAKLPPRLEERVRIMLLNLFDAALENPVEDEREAVIFLRALKRLLETCFDKNFQSYDRLLQLAENNPSLEVFFEVIEVLVSRLKTYLASGQDVKLNLQNRLVTLLKSYTAKSPNTMEIQQPNTKRFGELSEEEQLRLNIFSKVYLYLINANKYPVTEQQTRTYFNLLKDRPYTWLLNILQGLKCQQLNFVCRDILDSKISLTPNFHYEGNTRYIHKEIINSEALQIAVSKQKALLISVAHSPGAILQTETALYFKFNLLIYRMDELCFGIWDTGEVMPVNEQIETQFNDIVNFIAKILEGFHKDFVVLTTDGEKTKIQKEKLALLEINLRCLEDIIQKYNLKESSKLVIDRSILNMCLALVDSLLKKQSNVSVCWEIVKRCLNLYKLLTSVHNANIVNFAVTNFPELIVSIIDGYNLPENEVLLNDIFLFAAAFLDILVKKAGRPIPALSSNFTRKMLNAYFESDYTSDADVLLVQENSLQHYLKKQKSPQAQVVFNEFIIERLKVLQSPEHTVERLMENPRMRQRVVNQINKMLRVLDSAVIKLQPVTSKLLTFRLMQYFILFEDQVSYNLLVRIKKKLEFQDADLIYKKALLSTQEALEKEPFSRMTIQCLLREFGNEMHEDWTTILQIFRNLHMVIFLNMFKKGDYSEATFSTVFKIVRLLCKCKTEIQQRLSKELQKEGVAKIKQLQLLASIKGLETTYGLLYSFFKRLKNGLAAMKNEQNRTQQTLNLDQQINFIAGLKQLFPILTQNVSKHEMILYVDSFSDVLYGYGAGPDVQHQELMSLHMVLNLYATFKEALFKTVNTLNSLIVDKKKIHNSNYFRLKTLDDYIDYFNRNGGESFDIDIEDKFAQSVNKLLRLFILQPVAINLNFKYRGVDYQQGSASKMALGMYVDQFDQLVKTANLGNLELYSKCIRYFLQQYFYENLLFSFERRQSQRHNTRATRQAVQALLRMGIQFEVARHAIFRIADPDPESALEWINENQEELQNIERGVGRPPSQQYTWSRRRQHQPQDPNAIQEIDHQNIGDKMLPHLKRLIKEVLFANLYSEYSEMIQSMLIQSIERFEKEDSKLKHYKHLLEKIIEDVSSSSNSTDGILASFDQQRVNIDLTVLKLIIQKCPEKRQIKQIYLSSKCLNELLGIVSFICKQNDISEIRQKIIHSALNVVGHLMPSKSRKIEDQKKVTSEIYAIISALLVVVDSFAKIRTITKRKALELLVVQCLHKTADFKGKEVSQLCIELLMRLLQSENVQLTVFDAIDSLLMNEAELIEPTIESEIKSYFFNKKAEQKIIKVQKAVFLAAMEKYTRSPCFLKICKLLLKRTFEKHGNKKVTNFVFNQENQRYSQSSVMMKDFINYTPSDSTAKIIKGVVNGIFNKAGLSTVHIKILHHMLNKFPLLIPYTLNHPLEDYPQSFLEKIIIHAPESETELWNFMFFLCLRCSLVVKNKDRQDLFSTYVQARVLLRIKDMLQSSKQPTKTTSWLLLLLCNLLQIQEVTRLARAQTSLTDLTSIQSVLEEKIKENPNSKESVFSNEALSLIYKELTLTRLKGKYKLHEDAKEGPISQQLLPLALIFSDSSNERRQLIEELERTGEQLENEQDNAQALILTWERRMNRYTQIFTRRTFNRQNLQLIPVDPEESKEKQKTSQIVVEEQAEPVATLQNHMFVEVPFDYTIPSNTSLRKPAPPKDFLSLLELEQHYEQQSTMAISYQFQKNSNFRGRLLFLSSSLRDKKLLPTTMQIQPPPKQKPQGRPDFSDAPDAPERIRFIRANNSRSSLFEFFPSRLRRDRHQRILGAIVGEDHEDVLVERFGEIRDRDSRDGRQNRPANNEFDIIRRLDFRLRRMEERLDTEREHDIAALDTLMRGNRLERPGLRERRDDNQLERVLDEYVEPPRVEPRPESRHSQRPEARSIVPEIQVSFILPEVATQSNQVMELQQELPAAGQSNMMAEGRVQERPLPEQIQQELPASMVVPPVPPAQIPAPVAIPPIIVQPQPQFRHILQAMNLPQTFLRDNGLQEDLFDTLPETIQMQILIQTMGQNPPQPPVPRPEGTNPPAPGAENVPEDDRTRLMNSTQPRSLVNEHVALLASIEDPALREEMLIEATPELLASLPAQIQAEAELLRQRRVRQLALEYEEDDLTQEMQSGRKKKSKKPPVYPEITASLFGEVPEDTILSILKLLYWSFPRNYKPITVQALLQNKLMQPKIITTLIYILRNPLTAIQFPQQITFWKEEKTNDGQLKPPSNILRDNVLGVLLDLFSSCPYKDSMLMKEKIPYIGLCGIVLQPKAQFNQNDQDGYQPYVELLNFALDHSTELSAYFLAGVTDLPEALLRKLVKKLYNTSIDDMFIHNLKGLADNQELARIFGEQVTETHHPSISIYAHLLKYKFANTKYLPKLHIKALASYKPEYNQFLNQIYRIYTLDELKNISQLGQYRTIHRNVIKGLLAKKSKFSEEPISIIMRLPFLMDFQTKKQIFQSQIRNSTGDRHFGRLQIKVHRKDLFRMSFNQIMARSTNELRSRLNVSFEDEMAYDAGGVTRDWFLAISRQMFNPNYALFQPSTSGNTYQPSSKSFINPDHLKYFKFIGRIVGKALAERECIDAFFTRSFYKLILGQDLELADLQEQDFNLYKSLLYYKENQVLDELTFSYVRERFGIMETKDLVPNGKNILVNEENKMDYIQRMSLAKMRDDIQPQIQAFLEGFHELIPQESIKFFDSKELELLISGLPNIDIDDLKSNTEYSGYAATDNIIRWFWQILQTYDQEHLAQVIQFITGTSKIPAGGFRALRGMHGPQKISIHKDYDVNHLPQAHTCYNQLELPEYASKAILEKKLQVAFKWGNEGFGFM